MSRINELKNVIDEEIAKGEFWDKNANGELPTVIKEDLEIANPFRDETDYFDVNPMEYYNFTNEEMEVYYKGWNIK